jgi:hypothetical protein
MKMVWLDLNQDCKGFVLNQKSEKGKREKKK